MSSKVEDILSREGSDRRRVSTNGQITLPKLLREEHGLVDGEPYVIGENDDGEIVLKPVRGE